MARLSRNDILTVEDLKREEVPVPEWGGEVLVRTLTGSERDQFEAAHLKAPDRDVRARLAAATLCDEEGKPLFTPDDVAALGRKSAAALDRVFSVGMRINGIGKADVEELAKN